MTAIEHCDLATVLGGVKDPKACVAAVNNGFEPAIDAMNKRARARAHWGLNPWRNAEMNAAVAKFAAATQAAEQACR